MPYEVAKMEVWTAEIDDRPGGLAEKLEPLAAAGVDLSFAIARREPHRPGKGVVFISGVKGAKAQRAAKEAGFVKASDLTGLRVEGPNKPGLCHLVCQQLAEAGINLRGLSAGTIGSKCVFFLAFDSAADATKASRVIKAIGAKRRGRCKR